MLRCSGQPWRMLCKRRQPCEQITEACNSAGRSLSSREESCLSECAKRFIETTQVSCHV